MARFGKSRLADWLDTEAILPTIQSGLLPSLGVLKSALIPLTLRTPRLQPFNTEGADPTTSSKPAQEMLMIRMTTLSALMIVMKSMSLLTLAFLKVSTATGTQTNGKSSTIEPRK